MGVFSSKSSRAGGAATAHVKLPDGREGDGTKLNFGIRGATKDDERIARDRALDKALSKPVKRR